MQRSLRHILPFPLFLKVLWGNLAALVPAPFPRILFLFSGWRAVNMSKNNWDCPFRICRYNKILIWLGGGDDIFLLLQ